MKQTVGEENTYRQQGTADHSHTTSTSGHAGVLARNLIVVPRTASER
jgi:hypothetical protein